MPLFCGVELSSGAILAPMAGFTDDIFRCLSVEQGAIITISEMVSARAVTLGDTKSGELCNNYSSLSPFGIQLFGSRPEDFSIASSKLMQYRPDFFDINCGCPAPKITGSGGGSSLLKNPELIGEIVASVKAATGIAVSIKLRTGIEGEPAAVKAAICGVQGGAELVTVHGRYQRQGYRPPVDYDIAAEVKKNIKVPMIFNGDVSDINSANLALKKSNADGVMIGRAALGNPFIFSMHSESVPCSMTDRVNMLMRHAELINDRYGTNGLIAFRTHITHYIKGFRNAASMRREAVKVTVLDDVRSIANRLSALN